MNWVTIRAALHAWVVACTGLSDQKITWARQRNTPRPDEDGIVMKLLVADDDNWSWLDTETNPLSFANKSITAVAGSNLTITAHGLVTGDGPVQLVGSDLPLPITTSTNYWVIRIDANTIQLAVQFEDTGGNVVGNPITPITLIDAGSGVKTLISIEDTLRAGQEINYVQRGYVRMTLQLFSYVHDDTGMDGAIAILRRVSNRYRLPSIQALLEDQGVGVVSVERTRSMLGTRNAVMFEPRAWVDIYLSATAEERETGGIIGRTEITREEPDPDTLFEIEGEDL